MVRTILCSVALMVVCVGCKGKTDKQAKEATITKMDAAKGTAVVKMQKDGKDVEKTFKLAERIEYMDSAGDVAAADIFTSGDRVVIFETEGTITKMKHKDKAAIGRLPDSKEKADIVNLPDSKEKADIVKLPDNKDKADKQAKSANETFIRAADQINLAEMKIGKVAEENAKSGVVKKFGEKIVHDHSFMNKELRKITTKQGIKLTEKLDPKHQELLDDLTKLKAVAFDKAYTKDMVAGHEKAIELFEHEVKTGRNADVKAWAEKCLPTLREHLKLAQAAVKDVKGK